MIIDNNAGGHIFRDRKCIRCKMTKDEFAGQGYPNCKGAPPIDNKCDGSSMVQDRNSAA